MMDQTQAPVNNAKLFVGNLNYAVTSDDLRDLFSQHGNVVDAIVLSDKFSGRSKGFGFVTFETAEEASAALEALNEQDFQGRNLALSVARPPQPRENRGFGGGSGGYNRGGGNDRRGGGGYSRGGRGGGDSYGGGYSNDR